LKLKFWERSAPPTAADAPTKPRRNMLARSLMGLFKSAETTGNDKWTATPVTIDSFISQHQQVLVARSREQWSNNDYVRAFHRLIRQNVVGPIGVTMQAKAETARGKLDKDANTALEADWADWGKKGNCDVTGKLTWREVQCLAVETAARDGEFILRKIYGAEAGAHGFAVQFIDPQRLPVWYENNHMLGGGFIRHGIEFNRYGRAVAYHFTSTDESDVHYYGSSGRGFVRIPAEDIIHEFIVEMVGQRRGLPWASTSLKRLRNINGFEDAAVQNARAGASKMGFIQYEAGFGPEVDDNEPLHIEAEPLSFQELPEGAKLAEFSPQYPSGETAPFLKSQLRGASSGMGVPYNELANDLEGVNFSSIRQLTLDAREHYKEVQQWLIDALIDPVREAHLKVRMLSGAVKVKGKPLDAAKIAIYRKVSWQPRRWQWIDPRADVDAALKAIRGGLTSISQVIREQGRDPETVFQEFAADLVAMKAAGIPDDIILLFLLGQPPAPTPEEKPTPAKAEE
jgi:lambda family phage portal protein